MAAVLSHDSFDADQRAESNAADFASAEEYDDDAACLVGDHAFESRVSAPWLDAHRAHESGKRGREAKG